MPDDTGPIEAVRQYIAAFNKGDPQAMGALFDASGSILDGMAPHVWEGPTACLDWYREVLKEGEHVGAKDYFITVGEPSHADVTGDNSYVVVPATMTFKLKGQQITQSGATYTVALHKTPAGWRIRAWAWAKGTPAAT